MVKWTSALHSQFEVQVLADWFTCTIVIYRVTMSRKTRNVLNNMSRSQITSTNDLEFEFYRLCTQAQCSYFLYNLKVTLLTNIPTDRHTILPKTIYMYNLIFEWKWKYIRYCRLSESNFQMSPTKWIDNFSEVSQCNTTGDL